MLLHRPHPHMFVVMQMNEDMPLLPPFGPGPPDEEMASDSEDDELEARPSLLCVYVCVCACVCERV
jgi:hypothetical protein